MLRNGDDDRLMVSRRVDGRKFVESRRKTASDISSQHTSDSSRIETLEEDESLGVGGSRLGKGGELLNNDVRVSCDLACTVQHLGSSKVVLLRIDEEPSLHVLNSHRDSERRVRLDRSKVLGVSKLR